MDDDRSERLQRLFAMFEQSLKRELTHEERRLLALADLYLADQDLATADAPAWDQTGS